MTKRASSRDRGWSLPTLFVVGGAPRHEAAAVGLDADAAAHIADPLRAMYDFVLREPLPNRFLDLLHELDDKTIGAETATPEPPTVKQPDGEA
ncbi:hypothetical protein GCM10011611_46230 [Aliidongia dinghuensis]|uniref:Anti-sigma factor NepR domain-containing protein n=1 Tax=Aliidongia dinghuensis TaxID=1867774 RepID=A0A8J2YXG5_9PROT|nr:NepR family anti-sigma factor [Aliidongia dinghuensis]GGF34742.1 hypothetical protein GCM10011611_46230 [Aliidongia dinghuensis]